MAANPPGGGGAYTQASLPALPVHLQSDTHITAHLASRFHVSLPTAQLSSHALVSLNTYASSTKGPDGSKEGSAMGGAEELADRAFTRLGARSENQSVVFLGESGSGKTTIRAHLLSALLAKSATPLSKKLSLAAYVFDTLTTTKTATTPSASKAGLFYELQYDTASTVNPTLIGGKLLDHRLERTRVANVPTGERNFHVLYYLLAGTSTPEKAHLGFDTPGALQSATTGHKPTAPQQKRWRYLGHPTQLKVGINDAEGFQLFKTALRKLEFSRGEIAEICQVLASILHLGQLEFGTSEDTTAMGDDSGGFSHEGGESHTAVKNKDVLAIIAAFLGVGVQDLETTLGYKTKVLQRERVTIMLDPKGARGNADELARTLYSLLVAYVLESINSRLCASELSVANTISIVDFPGFAQQPSTYSVLDQLLNNAATESLYNFTLQSFFENKAEMLESEEVSIAATSYFDNSDAVKGLLKHGNGLLSILDDQTRRNKTDSQLLESLRKRFAGKNPAINVGSATTTLPGSNFATHNASASFTVKHFAGEVDYVVAGLVEENGEVISGDLMNLISSTKSDFVGQLFGQEALQTVVHPQEKTTIMQAQVSSKPLRKPSVMRRKGDRRARLGAHDVEQPKDPFEDGSDAADSESSPRRSRNIDQGAAAQFLSSLDNVTKALTAPNSNPYFVFCLKPNDRRIANQFDNKCVRTQVQTFGIAEISQRLRNADFGLFLPFGEFLNLCEAETILVGSEREKSELVLHDKRWPANEARVGSTGVFLSERCWAEIAKLSERGFTQARYPVPSDDGGDMLSPNAGLYGNLKEGLLSPGQSPSPGGYGYGDKKSGYFGSHDVDSRSDAGISALGQGDMFRNLNTKEQLAQRGNEKAMVEVEEVETTSSRKRWVFIVWLLTWIIPDFLVKWIGRMPRKDVRMAWREKLAINMIIWTSCLFLAWFIVIFPQLICPKQFVFSASELSAFNGKGTDAYTSIRGVVYDLTEFAPLHYPFIVPEKSLLAYAGLDITSLFPVQVSALCIGVNGTLSPFISLDYTNTNISGSAAVISSTDTNSKYHDFRPYTGDNRPDWWWEQQTMLEGKYKKGNIGYTSTFVHTLSGKQQAIATLNGKVYDFSRYLQGGRSILVPDGETPPTGINTDFMDASVVSLFQDNAGGDVTKLWTDLPLDPEIRTRMQTCLNNLFYVGDVDTRNSVKCQFAQFLLLAVSILLCSVIGFKFFAALQFGSKNTPENLDKFVICQVSVYTEDEDSVRRAVDSAARMKYDDKRKLLVIICDGMIIGQGNDRPTPRIVLDILGVSDTVDPEPLSFESLGDGLKQHNMGKVYSGLYEVQGHIVPFMVIVKVGKPSEVSRPGNRGKRDSQVVMMRFLNRVHYNAAMSPLELEMYHQIRNIIGVNPAFYEFMLQIDADTVVAPDSASRLVSAFVDDTRLLGACGETALSNAKSSFVTMIQVYEYYISHNLSKAFESLFGSVTCLPGCFTMYRIRASESGKPLFVSREVVDAYSTMRVDTLHTKNLLHLGEDRYLTTLLIKHHPKYKTKYIFSAHAWTIAPDSWKVFVSQRRRWINSTVHNLIELAPMAELCGFCCFSMRFIVFIDLLSTLVQPVIPVYIGYLIVIVILRTSVIPITAFILLGVIYGLQALIFILRRKWEMVGWMVLYILALPVFAFGLPLYSFWHMDDFSWGNTRIVTGEAGRKVVITDEGKFDPASIPKKKWEEYQAELWEAQTTQDDRSEVSGVSYGTKSFYAPAAEYNQIPTRPLSQPLSLMPGANFPYDPNPNPNPSRMSIAASEMLSPGNRQSQFGGSQIFGQQDLEMSSLAGLPSDDEILVQIREILKSADLMNVTKKSIKADLERHFGVPLESRRTYINTATEALLSGQL